MECKNKWLERDGFCTQCGKKHTIKPKAVKKIKVIRQMCLHDLISDRIVKDRLEIYCRRCGVILGSEEAPKVAVSKKFWAILVYTPNDFEVKSDVTPNSWYWSNANVLKIHGEMYISSSLLHILTGYDARDMKATYLTGRKRWFELSKEIITRVEERSKFPRRNKREEAVAKRNMSILTWIYLEGKEDHTKPL